MNEQLLNEINRLMEIILKKRIYQTFELLNEIHYEVDNELKYNFLDCEIPTNNKLSRRISTYEFINKCKIHFGEKGIALASWTEQGEDGACELVWKEREIKITFKDSKESYAVIKACAFVLNLIENNSHNDGDIYVPNLPDDEIFNPYNIEGY